MEVLAPSNRRRSQALCWGQSLANGLGRQAVIQAQPGPGETLENPSDGQLSCFAFFLSFWLGLSTGKSLLFRSLWAFFRWELQLLVRALSGSVFPSRRECHSLWD